MLKYILENETLIFDCLSYQNETDIVFAIVMHQQTAETDSAVETIYYVPSLKKIINNNKA